MIKTKENGVKIRGKISKTKKNNTSKDRRRNPRRTKTYLQTFSYW